MNYLLLFLGLHFASSALAINYTFLRAITLCDEDNNPMSAIEKLGGDTFGKIEMSLSTDFKRYYFDGIVLKSDYFFDRTKIVPVENKGRFKLEYYYKKEEQGERLICKMKIIEK
jgi:hypothetical protein